MLQTAANPGAEHPAVVLQTLEADRQRDATQTIHHVGTTLTGAIQLIRLTFNIASGASGTIVPTLTVTEALATTSLINVTSSVAVQTLPTLIIP